MADNIIDFKKGDIVCEEGKYELWFYEILSGSASIYRNYGQPEQQEIGKASGGFIGEMGFINSLPRIATVVADEDMSLAKIDEDSFNDYFKNHPDKIYDIVKCLSGRLGEIDASTKEALNTLEESLGNYEAKNGASGGLKAAMKKFSDIFRSRKSG